jgi:hypothetical protein
MTDDVASLKAALGLIGAWANPGIPFRPDEALREIRKLAMEALDLIDV